VCTDPFTHATADVLAPGAPKRDARGMARHALVVLLVLLPMPASAQLSGDEPCDASLYAEAEWWPMLDGRVATERSELRVCEGEHWRTALVLDTGDRVLAQHHDRRSGRIGALVVRSGAPVDGVVIVSEPGGTEASCTGMVTPGSWIDARWSPGGALVLSWPSGSDSSEAFACHPDGHGEWLSGGTHVVVSPNAAFVARYAPAASPIGDETFSVYAIDGGREIVHVEADARATAGIRWVRSGVEIDTAAGTRRFGLPRRWP
jgi:hypothetical protein